MKKLMLAASLCIVAAVVAPITSSSALTTGSCKIVGNAEFKKGAIGVEEELPITPEQRGFRFFAVPGEGFKTPGESGCHEAPNVELKLGAKTSVEGEGQLACAVANGKVEVKGKVEGTGEIEVGAEPARKFFFRFVAAGGNVVFEVEEKEGDGVKGAGNAEFLTPGTGAEKATLAKECAEGHVKHLKFEAVTAGTF